MIKKFIGALAVEPQPKQEWNPEGTEGKKISTLIELSSCIIFVSSFPQ
jgi:hypothetical protein